MHSIRSFDIENSKKREHCEVIQFAADELRADRDFVLQAVQQLGAEVQMCDRHGIFESVSNHVHVQKRGP